MCGGVPRLVKIMWLGNVHLRYLLAIVHFVFGLMLFRRSATWPKGGAALKAVVGLSGLCVLGFIFGTGWDSLIELREFQGLKKLLFMCAVVAFHLLAIGIVWEFIGFSTGEKIQRQHVGVKPKDFGLRLSSKGVVYCICEVIVGQIIGLILRFG